MKAGLYLVLATGILFVSCSRDNQTSSKLNQSPAGEASSLPYLFTGPAGRVWMSWIEQTDTLYTLKFSEANSAGWSEPKIIAQSSDWFVNWADYPMLVTNDSGKFAAHVLEKSGPGKFSYDIRIFTSVDDGNTWDNSFLLNNDGLEAEHGFVSMQPWNGKIFFTWLDGRQTAVDGSEKADHEGHHGSMSLRSGVRSYSGEVLAEWLVDDRTCDCCQTTAWIGQKGPVVFYRDRSEDEIRDISVSRLDNGSWSTPTPVYSDGWEIKGCPVNGPRAAGSMSNVAVGWFTGANDQTKVFTAISNDAGQSFSPPIRVDEGNANGRVDVISTEKNYLVSWLEGDEIRFRSIDQTGKPGPVTIVAKTSSSRPSGFPQMTSTRNGDVLFAWTDINKKRILTKYVKSLPGHNAGS